ncbi:MAG: hypothetical protein NTZ17_04340 [Phycisphaerae bacterium]|nr:hypothetical protein [Phycisphaerae bacterium]
MDRQQIALKLAADGLGLDFKIKSFQDRSILQKVMYLVQAARVHMGYHYQWYLHGPYSPSLARDEFAVTTELAQDYDESEGWTLDEQSKATLGKLRRLAEAQDRADLARKLELLASVHFLITRQQVAKTSDDQQILDVLKRFGKPFSLDDVEMARRELCEYELL